MIYWLKNLSIIIFCLLWSNLLTDDNNQTLLQLTTKIFGNMDDDEIYYENSKKLNKVQKIYSPDIQFFCDPNGPGKRSDTVPNSIHKIRPGDIDIIAAIGDSLTAGVGILSTNLLQLFIANRGLAWSAGGQGNWRKFLTLPNILKEFNSNLYGYSFADTVLVSGSENFNMAEYGATSKSLINQAELLVKKLISDSRVNMTYHWKMLTILIGNNDFCTTFCYKNLTQNLIKDHENDLLKTLKYLQKNVPRLLVNLVPPPNNLILTEYNGLPFDCQVINLIECNCLTDYIKNIKFFDNLIRKWQQKEMEVADFEEFNNKNDFVVNFQPFTQELIFPLTEEGFTDTTYLARDCFHLSQKGNARAANSLWNNMFEDYNMKTKTWTEEFKVFKCPNEKHPYIKTKLNSL